MTEAEILSMRSLTLLDAAEVERDQELQDIMLEQCFRLQRRAIRLTVSEKARQAEKPQAS